MKLLALILGLTISVGAYANCTTNARGVKECHNGSSSAGYNPNTGKGYTSQTNSNGVRTTQSNMGGEAKSMNGKGVATGPNGTKCYKTANSHGCN